MVSLYGLQGLGFCVHKGFHFGQQIFPKVRVVGPNLRGSLQVSWSSSAAGFNEKLDGWKTGHCPFHVPRSFPSDSPVY